jgi:hypothetical protein
MLNDVKNKSDIRAMLTFFFVWVLYAAVRMYLQTSSGWHAYAGYLSAAADIGLLVIVVSYAFWLWRNKRSSLRTTFSFWIFILCNLTLGVFLFAAYLFSPTLFF